MDDVFKALADATRRELLDRLREQNGQTLSELCDRLEMSRQAVTKHLAILEAANLVATVRQGREKLHYLNPVPINEIAERWIGKYEIGPPWRVERSERRTSKGKSDDQQVRLRDLHPHDARQAVGRADHARVHAAVLVRRHVRIPIGNPARRGR